MHNDGQRVADLAVEQYVQLDQLAAGIAVELVVEGRIAARARLERVKKVVDDLVEGHFVVNLHASRLNVLHIDVHAALLLAQLHDGAHIVGRREDLRRNHGLLHVVDVGRIGQISGVVDVQLGTVGLDHVVDHRGRGGNQIQIELALQALLNDLHVQQTQEARAEAEAQRHRGLRLKGQRGVVELELIQRVAQILIIRAIGGVDAAVDHGLHLLVARQHFGGRAVGGGDGIAHAGICDLLDGRADVAHVAGQQFAHRHQLARAEITHLGHVKLHARGHHADAVAHLDPALHHADEGERALVVVVDAVEDQRAQGEALVTLGCGDELDHGLQHVLYVLAGFGRDQRRVGGVQADHVLDLLFDKVRLGAGQIDLVDDGNDLQIVLQRHVDVGQRLRLDALRSVHHQHRTVARGQRARHLVGKVHMAGGVDQVERIGVAILGLIGHAHGLRLDGDAALALQIHVVQHLLAHLAQFHHAGFLNQTVGQRGFAVIDVRDNAEIANQFFSFQVHSSASR